MVIFRFFVVQKRKKLYIVMDIFIFSFFAVSYTSELVKLSLYDMVGSDILEPGHSTHGCGLHGDSVREIHNTTDPIERRLYS